MFATEAVATVPVRPARRPGTVNWYLTDNQGTVRDVVQLGDTTPVDHLVYSAFGQLLSQTASAAAATSRRSTTTAHTAIRRRAKT